MICLLILWSKMRTLHVAYRTKTKHPNEAFTTPFLGANLRWTWNLRNWFQECDGGLGSWEIWNVFRKTPSWIELRESFFMFFLWGGVWTLFPAQLSVSSIVRVKGLELQKSEHKKKIQLFVPWIERGLTWVEVSMFHFWLVVLSGGLVGQLGGYVFFW